METLLKCVNCGSKEFIETRCENGPHYAKVTCKNCHRFLKWAQSPELGAQEKKLAAKIKYLKQFPESVTSWEWEFLCNIEGLTRLSPRQRAIFDGIENKVTGGLK